METNQKSLKEEKGKTPNEAIVAFIDILGYGEVVNRLINDLEAIKGIENVLKGTSSGLIESIRVRLSLPEPYKEYSKGIFNLISVRYISDTMLFTLPFSDADISFPQFTDWENFSNLVFSYFYFIAMACTSFIGKTGLVLRGGISIGPHYENAEGESFFVFSQAYVNAYKLEKKAETPRILLDDEVVKLINTIALENLNKFVFTDNTGLKCLNIYAIFEDEERSPTILADIKQGISMNISDNKQNKRILGKLIHFGRYHNERVMLLGFRDMVINLLKAEQQFHSLRD